jgi:hypothetical protein
MSDLEQRETPRNSYRAARRDAPVGLNQRTDAMSKLPASQRARGRDRTALSHPTTASSPTPPIAACTAFGSRAAASPT